MLTSPHRILKYSINAVMVDQKAANDLLTYSA
jgi:hypothetical protein